MPSRTAAERFSGGSPVGKVWRQRRYSLTNGQITLIVPYAQERANPHLALDYLNYLESFIPSPHSPRRYCFKCREPIAKGHKYQYVDGKGFHHRVCARPDMYH